MALNRAYAVIEPRRWYWLRLELIGYTLVAAFTSLAMAFLIVLGPLIIEAARRHIPLIVETNEKLLNIARYGIAIAALVVALFILHAWLPAGRRGFLQILPGIVFTMVARWCRASCSANISRASPTTTSRCMPGWRR